MTPRRSNPHIGHMMEGFRYLIKTRRDRKAYFKGQPGTPEEHYEVDLKIGLRDWEGDLELDVLTLQKGRAKLAVASGELGRNVFGEHNTFVPVKHRGHGHMRMLYNILLNSGVSIVSDIWNHSPPMRRTWMRLGKEWPLYSDVESDLTENVGGYDLTPVPRNVSEKSLLLDGILFLFPSERHADSVFEEWSFDGGVDESIRLGYDSVAPEEDE